MKIQSLAVLLLILSSLTLSVNARAGYKSIAKVHHVVIVWLKQHGDEQARQQYITASKRLAKLPGVLTYHIGTPALIKRNKPGPGKDDSYDIAVTSSFADQKALENYLNHPKHDEIIQNQLKPLVDSYKAYDFIE